MEDDIYSEKETVSNVKSKDFMSEMKKLLEEVQNTIKATRTISPPLWTMESKADYYNLLENSVKDPDAMNLLKIRRHLVEGIKAGREEVQADIRKQLEKENFAIDEEALKTVVDRHTANETKSLKRMDLLTKSEKFGHLNKTYAKTVPKAVPKVQSQRAFGERVMGNKVVPKVTSSIPSHSFETKITENNNIQISQPSVAERISHLLKINDKKDTLFGSKYQVSTKDSNFKIETFAQDRNKYFPCAVPLAPPNRNKICEISVGILDQTFTVPNIHQSMPNEELTVPVVPKQMPITKEPVSIAVQKPVIRKEILNGEKSFNFKETSPTLTKVNSAQSVVPNSTSQKKLSMVILRSINIDGGKHFCEANKNNVENVESIEQVPSLQHSISCQNSSSSSSSSIRNDSTSTALWSTPQLSRILEALSRLREDIRKKNSHELDRKHIEEIVLESVQQCMHNPSAKEEKKYICKKPIMINIGTQVTEPFKETVCLTSATQTDDSISLIEKATQCIVTSIHNICTQTDVQNMTSKEIGINTEESCNMPLQHNCCTSNLLFHQHCNVPSNIVSHNSHNTANSFDQQSYDIKLARTSTPLDFVPENEISQQTKSTDTQDLLQSCSNSCALNHRNEDVSTAVLNQGSQTIPEFKEASVQHDSKGPITTCHSTMTQNVENRNISTQLLPEEIGSKFYNIDLNIDTKDIAIQSDFQDLSLSSTTSTVTTDDFVDDFLSEGEIPLPWNLRLLSLIERGVLLRSNSQLTESTTAEEKVSDEPSLSEGEIPPKLLAALQNISNLPDHNTTGSTSSFIFSSDTTGAVAESGVPKLICEQFVDSQLSSSKSDLSEIQIPQSYLKKPNSTLSSESTGEFQEKNHMFPRVLLHENSILSNNQQELKLPPHNEVKCNIFEQLDTSLLKPENSNSQQQHHSLSSSPRLERFLYDAKLSAVPAISRSPDLKTVPEEVKDNTEVDEFQPLSSEQSSKDIENSHNSSMIDSLDTEST